MNLTVPKALLSFDVFTVYRPSNIADSEGDPTGNRTLIGSARGTWRELTPNEQLLAAQRGQTFHAELGIPKNVDVQAGDFLTVRGNTYQVAAVDDLRSFRRCSLRTKEE